MKKILTIIVLFFLTQTFSSADPLSGTTWEIKYDDGDIHQITFHDYKDLNGNNCERKDLLDTNRLFIGGCKWTLYKNEFKINGIDITTFKHNHGSIDVQTFRIGNFAYSTDFKRFYNNDIDKLFPRYFPTLN